MADFKIQRGSIALVNGNDSVTLTAGTDYTAPSAASAAFMRLTNSVHMSNGFDGGTTEYANNLGAWIVNNGNITTSIDIRRYGTAGTVRVDWEIIEYTGSSGGANEFIVRESQILVCASNATEATGTAVSGINDDNDVVVWLTGQSANETAVNKFYFGAHITEWLSSTDQPKILDYGSTSNTSKASISVVEFTGANWKIQRTLHSFTAAGTTETETITAVGSVDKTFLHAQFRTFYPNLDELGAAQWLSATNTISYTLENGADVGHQACTWVIENTQSTGTVLNVQRFNGTIAAGTTTNPVEHDLTLSTVALAETGMGAITGHSTGTGIATTRALVDAWVADTTTAKLRKCEDGQTYTYRVEIVQWPTVGGGGDTALDGDAQSVAASTGALTTQIPVAGGAISQATANGSITTGIPLAASAVATVTAAGDLSTQIKLDASALSAANSSGALTTEIRLSGDALASAIASGALDGTAVALAGDAAASASASGGLITQIPLAGNAQAYANATGGLSTIIALAGAASSVNSATGELTVSFTMSADAVANAVASGELTTQISLSGAAVAQAALTGNLGAKLYQLVRSRTRKIPAKNRFRKVSSWR